VILRHVPLVAAVVALAAEAVLAEVAVALPAEVAVAVVALEVVSTSVHNSRPAPIK
jgi:hypothetical protein